MEAKIQSSVARRRQAAFVATVLFFGSLLPRGQSIRHNELGASRGSYTGWIMLFAVAGTLSAVAAIAISEAFVAPTLLVLTVGEWELLAAVFYILAILLYLGEGMSGKRFQ